MIDYLSAEDIRKRHLQVTSPTFNQRAGKEHGYLFSPIIKSSGNTIRSAYEITAVDETPIQVKGYRVRHITSRAEMALLRKLFTAEQQERADQRTLARLARHDS